MVICATNVAQITIRVNGLVLPTATCCNTSTRELRL
jgi:hypothetical protein